MGLIQQLVQLQNQIATVGLTQQTRLQQVLVGIDRTLLGLIVDGAKQGIPVQIPPIDDRRFLLFMVDQQIDEYRMLEFEPLSHVRREIGEEVIDLGIVVLFAHDAGDQALGIQMMAHQLEQFTDHFTELEAGAGLQAQPDGLERVVQIFGVAEIEQVSILAVGGGDQRLANAFIIHPGKTVEQHDRAVAIKAGETLDAGNGSGLQGGKRNGFEFAEGRKLFNRKTGFNCSDVNSAT